MTQEYEFERRLQLLQHKHASAGQDNAYVARVRDDGTVVAASVASRPTRRLRPLVLLIVMFAAFVGFKSLMLSYLGLDDYAKRLAMLQRGNDWEVAAAWALQVDPVTDVITYDVRPRMMTVVEAVVDRVARGDLALAANLPPKPDALADANN